MVRRLIIDTGVPIASEPERAGLASVITEEDDLVAAAITVADLRTWSRATNGLRPRARTGVGIHE